MQFHALIPYTIDMRRDSIASCLASRFAGAVAILALLVPHQVRAMDAQVDTDGSNVMALSLDQLLEVNVDKVYGASKFEQKITEAPSSVSIITRDEIQRQGYRTLADALRTLDGKPVLVVGEEKNFAQQGGMIGFIKEGGKVRFEINLAAAERAGLRMSAKLLQVGKIIVPGRSRAGD